MSEKISQGCLIVFEGLDGAGKTTQIELLSKHLKEKGYPVVITSWNSSRLISKAIKRAKKAHLLTPYLFSTLHAADFLYRLENIILPALREGYIVIADRYVYTALARDLARNINRAWIEHIYSLAPKPDIAFYCNTSIEESLERVMEKRGGEYPTYYESGMDIVKNSDAQTAFIEFQSRVSLEYEWIRKEHGLIEIDTTRSKEKVHEDIMTAVENRLKQFSERDKSPAYHGSIYHQHLLAEGDHFELEKINQYPSLKKHSYPGKFVVVSGPDKNISNRQANLLYNELKIRGYKVQLALLGKSWIGISVALKASRKTVISLPIKLLIAASEIALYYEQAIIPALQSGKVVIMNGYLADLFALFTASGLRAGWFSTMYKVFSIKPDYTIYIDASVNELSRRKSFRALLNISDITVDEHFFDHSIQQAIINQYRKISDIERWYCPPKLVSEKELHRDILKNIEREVLVSVKQEDTDESLREVLEYFSRFDQDFDHSRKVSELAVSLFDQTIHLHGYGTKEKLLLEYASYLHDIGHALSEERHEEFTYEAIMRQKFKTINESDQQIIANIASLHRQPYARMKFEHISRLSGNNQLLAKRLGALLRIADALDESGRQLIHDVRCYEEQGVIYIDIHSVPKARQERAAVLRKSDMFERVYQKPIVVARNWLEKRARSEIRVNR